MKMPSKNMAHALKQRRITRYNEMYLYSCTQEPEKYFHFILLRLQICSCHFLKCTLVVSCFVNTIQVVVLYQTMNELCRFHSLCYYVLRHRGYIHISLLKLRTLFSYTPSTQYTGV